MACEKCWADAYGLMMIGVVESQSEGYRQLLFERVNNQCSPEDVCGVGTTEMHTIHPDDVECACGKFKRKD